TMANVNVNAPAEQAPAMVPPTRTDDQILPRSSWVPQFWDTIRYVKNTGSYNCQLDEQWFDLTKDRLRDALQITPVDNKNPFSSPPTPNALINFVNEMGFPKVVRTLSVVVTNDMFQPWRALTTIINLCLTGRLQQRMWEEFTQSIHSFVEDKKNLALYTQGKKKANPIVIPSIRFTKLIIHHLQSKHKFHPRPDSLLHLPYEEYVLGYLNFSVKGTKQEVFGMPITNNLVTADIQGEQYYNAYLEKVAKHQRYLVGEEVSDPDSPAPKPAKATKPKATKQSKPLAPKAAPVTKLAAAKALKPTASQPPKPTPATTKLYKKDQSKKRKLVKESSEAPSPAKRPKAGKVIKKRTQKSSLQLVDEFVDEGIPVNEPRFGDEEADMQKAVVESLKDVHTAHQVHFHRCSTQPPTPSTNQSDQSKSTVVPSSSKTAASAEYTASTTIDTQLKPSVSSIPKDLHMDDDTAPDEQKPPSEEDRPAIPEPAWSIPSSYLPVPMNNWASALASTYAPPPKNSLLA
ncbi:hypothetical protein Tco_1026109, partial [Tanacetum coccineum]